MVAISCLTENRRVPCGAFQGKAGSL
uniref:Uncharacterized protein n=1 Tax=Anguilla anguilla TaxID=7936 RepID=A0A0E9UWG2_ANGAN